MDRKPRALRPGREFGPKPLPTKGSVPDYRRARRSRACDRRGLRDNSRSRLVLLGRTPLPPADLWENALAEIGTPDQIKQRIAKLIEIQALGAEVLAIPGDVSKPSDVKRAIELACATFGSINGVIHAAGVIDDGPLQLKSRDRAHVSCGPR